MNEEGHNIGPMERFWNRHDGLVAPLRSGRTAHAAAVGALPDQWGRYKHVIVLAAGMTPATEELLIGGCVMLLLLRAGLLDSPTLSALLYEALGGLPPVEEGSAETDSPREATMPQEVAPEAEEFGEE